MINKVVCGFMPWSSNFSGVQPHMVTLHGATKDGSIHHSCDEQCFKLKSSQSKYKLSLKQIWHIGLIDA